MHERSLDTENSSGNRAGDNGTSGQVGHAAGGCGSQRWCCHTLPGSHQGDSAGATAPEHKLLQVTRHRALTLLFFLLPLRAAASRFYPKPFVFFPFSCPSLASPAAAAGRALGDSGDTAWTRYICSGVSWGVRVCAVLQRAAAPLGATKPPILWLQQHTVLPAREMGGKREGGKRKKVVLGSFIPLGAAAGTYLCGWRVLAHQCRLGGSEVMRDHQLSQEGGWPKSPRAHPAGASRGAALGAAQSPCAAQPRNADGLTHNGADNSN